MNRSSGQPVISVVMAMFNAAPWIGEAVSSILDQTYPDFEVVVVDDGSEDESSDIVGAMEDSRIRQMRNESNRGLAFSLNRGIEAANGALIARMDADDVCHPCRFERQVAFLEEHPLVGACGSWVRVLRNGSGNIWHTETDPDLLACRLLFESGFCHPSVMMRKTVLESLGTVYDETLSSAQDFDLWTRLSRITRLGNIPEVLLAYRVHPAQVGQARKAEQTRSAHRVRCRQLEEMGLEADSLEIEIHEALACHELSPSREFVHRARTWLEKIRLANRKTEIFPAWALDVVLGERWLEVCNNATKKGAWAWFEYRRSLLAQRVPGKRLAGFKLFLKSLMP